MEQVAVTGMGIVSPVGSDIDSYWNALTNGEHGFTTIPGGEGLSGNLLWGAVPDTFLESSNVPKAAVRNADRFTQFAIAAASDAFAMAGVETPPTRTAVILGSTMGGLPLLTRTHEQFVADPRHVTPKLMALVIPNMASARVSLNWHLRGRQLTVSTACASSLDAIGLAAQMIERGETETAIAGGTETLLAPVVYESLQRAGALSKTPDAAIAVRPFDVARNGFVMSEGSAILYLERLDRAVARGARVLARVRGYGSMTDAYHLTAPEPTGQFEAEVIQAALDEAGCMPQTIFAHATGTVVGDIAELRAINAIYGDRRPVVTSLRGHLGHAMAAAGASSAIAGIAGMERGAVPQTLGTADVEPEARFDLVLARPRALQYDSFSVNAFGFGGQNASLVFSR